MKNHKDALNETDDAVNYVCCLFTFTIDYVKDNKCVTGVNTKVVGNRDVWKEI